MTSILDDIAPAFRASVNRWPDAPNIQTHYADLASTFETNGSSLIELCKSFIEMVCITIINELNKDLPTSSRPTTTEYLGCALDALGIRNQRGSSALGTILSGYNKLSNGLSNIRNQEGSVGHGKDGFIDAISARHARVYLLSADTVITLLLQAYDGVEPSILKTRESHSCFSRHNERIDALTRVDVKVDEDGVVELTFRAGTLGDGFDIRVPASELLYYLDRKAYVDVLDAIRGITMEPEEKDMPEQAEADTELPEVEKPEKKPEETATIHKKSLSGKLEPITDYQGKFAELVSPLYEFILHSILGGNSEHATQIQNLTYTLLNGMEDLAVIDWYKRNSTLSEVRLFLKKLVKLFSIEGIKGDSVDRIIDWLAKRTSGGEE
ncbi:MAG: abortive infection family protein [Acidobacteria bacterium]|nr:abortive infection family protein [Acidobacteriota bacterium]